MRKIGFVGLDATGQKIAVQMMKENGRPLMGYDEKMENRTHFDVDGGIAVEDPHIIYENCDLIILWFPDGKSVMKVIEDILATRREGLAIINISPKLPTKFHELKRRSEEQKISLLEIPLPEYLIEEEKEGLENTHSKVEAYRKMQYFVKQMNEEVKVRRIIQ